MGPCVSRMQEPAEMVSGALNTESLSFGPSLTLNVVFAYVQVSSKTWSGKATVAMVLIGIEQVTAEELLEVKGLMYAIPERLKKYVI